MKKRIWKFAALSLVLTIISLSFTLPALAGKPSGGGTISFGITAGKAKMADASTSYGGATYGPGYHNMVIVGNVVYAAYTNTSEANGGEREVRVVTSNDGGLTWRRSYTVARGADIELNGAALAVTVNPADPQYSMLIHVIWGEYNPALGQGSIYYSKSSFQPSSLNTSWTTPLNVSGPANAVTYARSIAADGSGGIHIAFTANNSSQHAILYSRSSDYGATFNEIATAVSPYGPTYGEPSIAADSAGNAYVAWNGSSVFFSKRLAGSSSWTAPVGVNGNNAANYPSLAVYNSNQIYIAWRATLSAVYVAGTTNGGASWQQYLAGTVSGSNDPSIAVSSTGVLNVAWDVGGASAYFSRSTNGGSTWTTPVKAVSDGDMPNLAVDSAGKACIMFQDRNAGVISFTREK